MLKSFSGKNLSIGDCFITPSKETYVYLGKFNGTPDSLYDVPDNGHLYVFFSRFDELKNAKEVLNNILIRARIGFDGNFCYTKTPKKFESKVNHFILDKDNYKTILDLQFCDDLDKKENEKLDFDEKEFIRAVENHLRKNGFTDVFYQLDDEEGQSKLYASTEDYRLVLRPTCESIKQNKINECIELCSVFGEVINQEQLFFDSQYTKLNEMCEIIHSYNNSLLKDDKQMKCYIQNEECLL